MKKNKSSVNENIIYNFLEFSSDGIPRGVNSGRKKIIMFISLVLVTVFFIISLSKTGGSDLFKAIKVDIKALPYYIKIPFINTDIIKNMFRVFIDFFPPNIHYLLKHYVNNSQFFYNPL